MSKRILQGLGIDSPRQPNVLASNTNDLRSRADDLASFRSGRTTSSTGTSDKASRGFGLRPNTAFTSANGNFKIPIFVKRFFKPPTLDFETAMWEIFYLVVSPKKVYRFLYYHKQTKNRWARDDPSFVILLALFLTISAIAWGVTYSPGFGPILKLILYMVFIDFFVVGVIISTAGWFLAKKFLKKQNSIDNIGAVTENDLEWAYCFDVHCNAFLVIWLALYLVQFVLLPLLTMNNWFGAFIGNTLYFFSLSYYFVITFYGYSALPFLEHTQVILFPIFLLTVGYIVSLFGFNIAKTMTDIYFN